MELDIIEDGGRRIGLIRLHGEFGAHAMEEFRRHLGTLMVPGKDVRHYVIDFTHAGGFDRTVTGSLLSVLKRIRDMQGDIRLSGIGPKVGEALSLAKLDEVFRIHGTRGEAVRSYREVI
jgi:anti-anti-sigma factor